MQITFRHSNGLRKWANYLLIFQTICLSQEVLAVENAIGIEGGAHPRAQTWVQGKKDQASYLFKGTSWLVYITHYDPKPTPGVNLVLPTLAVWGDSLVSNYSAVDPSGIKAAETIETQGIGGGYIGRVSPVGLSMAMMVGIERASLHQTGDTPTSQKYPYGFSSRLGLGFAPINKTIALDLRVDWVFKHFPSAKSKTESLKVMQQQSFVPKLGLSLNF